MLISQAFAYGNTDSCGHIDAGEENCTTPLIRRVAWAVLAAVALLGIAPSQALAAQAPYHGTPVAVPGVWQAEDFDFGGEGVAYHDNVAGNVGGQYRAAEDVDIIVSSDAEGGGYVVNNLETGEWLEYTINVPAAGFYSIAIRVSNNNWSPTPAFRVEIENRGAVSGAVAVPSTGSWSEFQWTEEQRIYLVAGEQVLRLVAVQQYFDLNSIRISDAPDPAPFTGTPISVPSVWEAEAFDLGGAGVAYHDTTVGNAGGQYRPNENVDIIASADPQGGGYVINNLETGEWLIYTIDAVAAGYYDIAVRASNGNWSPTPAFHLEIDGVDVTGSVDVQNTGSWSSFAWVNGGRVHLAAGTHVLKLFSNQQYFDLNQIRIATPAPRPPSLLFWSGFEDATILDPPTDCYGGIDPGCWQSLSGTDDTTGDSWPPSIWGGSSGRFQLIADTPVDSTTVSNYIVNQFRVDSVRSGERALYVEIKQSGCCGTNPQGSGGSQDPYILSPTELQGAASEGDLYISYWLRFQPELEQLMEVNTPGAGWHWRAFFEWKSAGDYRVLARVLRDPFINGGQLFWRVEGDNEANCQLYHPVCPGYQSFWSEPDPPDYSVAVPVGEWFKVEVFWHRSAGGDGRVWFAINGQVIANRYGSNIGVFGDEIDRIMIMQAYTSTAYPVYQWVDDLQIWSGFPTAAPGDPWYDPPYAPH